MITPWLAEYVLEMAVFRKVVSLAGKVWGRKSYVIVLRGLDYHEDNQRAGFGLLSVNLSSI